MFRIRRRPRKKVRTPPPPSTDSLWTTRDLPPFDLHYRSSTMAHRHHQEILRPPPSRALPSASNGDTRQAAPCVAGAPTGSAPVDEARSFEGMSQSGVTGEKKGEEFPVQQTVEKNLEFQSGVTEKHRADKKSSTKVS